MIDRIPCPHCSRVFALEQALDDMDGRKFFELFIKLPPTVMRPYLSYIGLFRPKKQVLKWRKILVLTEELAPMILKAQVTRNRMDYRIPLEQWAATMTDLVTNTPKTLELPLKGHGYLLSILANQAEKHAALQEEKVEQQKRNRGASGADEGLKPIAEVLYEPKPAPKPTEKQTPSQPPEGWRNDIKI